MDVRLVELSQDVGATLQVKVKHFIPQTGDCTGYTWRDRTGAVRHMEMPHFCLADLTDTKKRMFAYLKQYGYLYLEQPLRSTDEVFRDTFWMAKWMAEGKRVSLPEKCSIAINPLMFVVYANAACNGHLVH